jgi:tyrosine-specific transport protein
LRELLNSENSTSGLVNGLNAAASSHSIHFLVQLFTSICVLTSFLGVSLCLTDFWADALQLEKKGMNSLIVTLATFFPPLIIVLFSPGIFVGALKYAGIYCIVLLVFLPSWMVLAGRRKHKEISHFTMPLGKLLPFFLMVLSVLMVGQALL